jgi:hypothetical protein
MKDFWRHVITNCKKELSAIPFVAALWAVSIASGAWPHIIIIGLALGGLIYMLFQTYKR